jgi:aminopeptidase N
VALEIEWLAQVPRTLARTGGIGRYFFLAQWFPKVAVLEDAGWNSHQFHSGTEFYSDYGVYDVRLRVPSGWVVGATGREQGVEDHGDGTSTHRYVQADVHDFAWTTSPDYLVLTSRLDRPNLPPVDIRLLLQPEHATQAGRHFAATVAALRYYGEWYGPYPYGHVTVVDPAWQSGSGGMEYPTLFTAGTRWWAPSGVTQPEGVTVHEAGHQFWYGIVGNNEFEHAWLDEGLNTFSTARTIEAAGFENHYAERFFGGFVPWVFRDIPQTRETDGNGLGGYRAAAESDAQSTPTWRYFPATGSRITYSKTALWLHTLERHLGWPVLQRILSTFFERWKFRHPGPDDFFAVVNEVSGQDLTWFFDEVYRSSNVFDYGVESLQSSRRPTRGFVEEVGALTFREGEAGEGHYETTVVARRYGEALFPVDVLVRFEDGSTARERWDGKDRWRAFSYTRAAKAASAEVDPDRVLLLDVNATNNSRTLAPEGEAAAKKWSLRWMLWLQDLMMTYGFFV